MATRTQLTVSRNEVTRAQAEAKALQRVVERLTGKDAKATRKKPAP